MVIMWDGIKNSRTFAELFNKTYESVLFAYSTYIVQYLVVQTSMARHFDHISILLMAQFIAVQNLSSVV